MRFDKATPALGKSTGYAAIAGKPSEIRTLDDSFQPNQQVVFDEERYDIHRLYVDLFFFQFGMNPPEDC